MRVRATRLSATGCNARKRDINIPALFAAQVGRSGFWYGDSYDEILSRNREALGPERVVNGDFSGGDTGWVRSDSTWTVTGGKAVLTGDGLPKTISQNGVFTVDKVYLVEFTVYANSSTVGFQNAAATLVASGASGRVSTIWIADTTALTFKRAGGTVNATLDDVSVREIVDWSKLVLFDDANGTVPVFSPFQSTRGVGLLLDRSTGLVLGSELLNGFAPTIVGSAPAATYNTATGVGAMQRVDVNNQSSVMLSALALSGGAYRVKLRNTGGNQLSIRTNNGASVLVAVPVGGTFNGYIPATGYPNISLMCDANGGGTSFVVETFRFLPGNHRVQPTAAARGEISRRYNLIDNSGWVGGGAVPTGWTRTVGTGASEPVGTTSDGAVIYRQYGSAGERPFLERVGANVAAGDSFVMRMRIHAVAGTVRAADVLARVGSAVMGTTAYAWNGTPVSGNFPIAEAGVLTLTLIVSSAGTNNVRFGPGCSGGMLGDYDVQFSSPDFRLTADAIPSIPAYQRVTSAFDYDDVGFPAHHREQTDDWGYTDLAPAGATKALVMWAGQKMSDATLAILVEHGPNANTTNGTFYLTLPHSGGSQVGMQSRGTVNSAIAGATPVAPARLVLQGVSDIPGALVQVFSNGVQVGQRAGDQGTGGYTSQRTYFGARAGTGLFANTRTFAPPMALFMQPGDPGLTASQLTALQKRFAKSVGVTL